MKKYLIYLEFKCEVNILYDFLYFLIYLTKVSCNEKQLRCFYLLHYLKHKVNKPKHKSYSTIINVFNFY